MTAGYSGTPLVKKLGYKSGFAALIMNEPGNYRELLGDLPESAEIHKEPKQNLFDLIHFFTKEKLELELELPKLKMMLKKDGMIWVSWPKKASGVQTDIDGNGVRSTGLQTGLVDIKVCAVDEIWSGLKFVYRKKDR